MYINAGAFRISVSIIHFSQSSFFSPARKSSPRSRYLLLPPSCTSFRLRFQIVVPRCQSPEDNLLPHSHLQYMYIYIAHSKKNQIIVDYRSVPLHLLLLPRTIRFETTAQPFRGNHGLSKGLAPPPPSSSWTPGFVADRREHQCRRRDLNSDYSLAPPREKGWTQPLVGFHKKKKKRKGRRNPPPFPNTWTREDGPSTDRSRATGTEFSSVRNASLRLCPAFYDAIFRPALHEIPSKSAGTLSQIVVVNCLRILRFEGGHLLDRALFRFLLLHEADAPGLVPHHYVHHESENQDSASGTWTIRAIYYRLID